MLTRRTLLTTAAALFASHALGVEAAASLGTAGLAIPRGVRLRRMVRAPYAPSHPYEPGRNAYGSPGQVLKNNTLVRVTTSTGVEGIGGDLPDDLIGRTLDEILELRDGRPIVRVDRFPSLVTGRMWGIHQATLLDLLAKVNGVSAARALGQVHRTDIPVYDGLGYMRDLDTGTIQTVVDDMLASRALGHRRFKLKIGRGRWPEAGGRHQGYDRDLAVIKAVQAAVGPECQVLVDANNFYNVEEALRLVQDTADAPLLWLEELFQEADAEGYQRLRAAVQERKLPTLLADGETVSPKVQDWGPLMDQMGGHLAIPGVHGGNPLADRIAAGQVQVSNVDLHAIGLLFFRDYAALLAKQGALVGPHTWTNQLRVLESAVLGCVAPNVVLIEDKRVSSPVVNLPLTLRDGNLRYEERPGLGIRIDEEAWRRECLPGARVVEA